MDNSKQKEAIVVAKTLLLAVAMPDEQIYLRIGEPRYSTTDYYRMACHMLFECKRCGNCCKTGNPIRLDEEDADLLAKHFKIPKGKALKKYTVPDPERPGVLNFRHILPCKFYDTLGMGCKIYRARPWSCRIFPFLGVYGSRDRVVVNESCPGAVETMNLLKEALEKVAADANANCRELHDGPHDKDQVKEAKERLRAAAISGIRFY